MRPIVASLTTPFRTRHPEVDFTILSRNSLEVLTMLENLEIDAGCAPSRCTTSATG